jgi:hypothetical protein
MHSILSQAVPTRSPLSHFAPAEEQEARLRVERKEAVLRARIEADSLTVRVSSPIASQAAFAGLGFQPTLGSPAKLAWGAKHGFELMAEVSREGNLHDAEQEARGALDDAMAWLGNGIAATVGPSMPGARLVEILKGLGCAVRPASNAACFADVRLGSSIHRILVGEMPDTSARLSFPAAILRVEAEEVRYAVELFALEANCRLRLARVSATPVASDRMRLTWDVVVSGGSRLARRLPDAFEALVIARDETARPLRILRSPHVAEAYLAAREHAAP